DLGRRAPARGGSDPGPRADLRGEPVRDEEEQDEHEDPLAPDDHGRAGEPAEGGAHVAEPIRRAGAHGASRGATARASRGPLPGRAPRRRLPLSPAAITAGSPGTIRPRVPGGWAPRARAGP